MDTSWKVMFSLEGDELAKFRYVMNCRVVPGGVPTESVYAVMSELTPQKSMLSGRELATQVVTGKEVVPYVSVFVPVEWKYEESVKTPISPE